MTNKKNNNNDELVSDDDDPTAELEILSLVDEASHRDAAPEDAANTSDYLDPDEAARDDDGTISELKSDLKTRTETIGQLQYDIEQLRAKYLEFESEIRAREDVAEDLGRELESVTKSRNRANNQLKKRDQSIKSVKGKLNQRDKDYRKLQTLNRELQTAFDQAAEAETELANSFKNAEKSISVLESDLQQVQENEKSARDRNKQLRSEMGELRQSLQDSQQTVAELQQYVDGRRSEWEAQQTTLAQQDESINQLASEQKTLGAELEQRRANIEKLNTEVASRALANRDLREEMEALQNELDAYQGDDFEAIKRTAAEQAGQLASNEITIRVLRDQFDHAETYADKLRRQLHDLIAQSKTSGDTRQNLQKALDLANAENSEGQNSLQGEKRISAELKNELDDARNAHALEVSSLRAELGEAEETVARNAEALDALDNEKQVNSELKQQFDDAQESHTLEVSTLRSELGEAKETVAQNAEALDALENEKQVNAELKQQLDDAQESHTLEVSTLRDKLGEAEEAVAQNAEAHDELESEKRISAELKSELDDARESHELEVSTLRAEIGEAEETLAQNAEAQAALESEKQVNTELKKELEDAVESHALEVRTIRFELGEAEESLAQNEVINEQLASDLIDTRSFRDELETTLGDSEQRYKDEIDSLTRQNSKLTLEIEAYEQKLETKNEAVNCLLSEIAKKNEQMESIHKIEEVIHDIDDRMSDRIDERVVGERDRITRVLTGHIDGRELRFPLFKDRLTIGRTQDNDIQVDAPYISRRHAVIVTEGDTTRIVDWGSKNGVSANSKRVTEHFLKSGDVVTIGTADFKYEERPKREA